MRSFLIVLSIFVGLPLLVKLGWSLAYPTYDFQRTLTIEVMTPDGPVKSVNTARLLYTQGPSFGFVDGASGSWKNFGEAPVVDLGNGQYLFALFDSSTSVVFDAAEYADFLDTGDRWRDVRKIDRARGVVWDVPIDIMPDLITFRDQSDFTSAMIVDPTNLAETVGPGFELVGMKVEVTNEPTTSGLILPLLSEWAEDGMPGFKILPENSRIYLSLNHTSFWSATPRIQD